MNRFENTEEVFVLLFDGVTITGTLDDDGVRGFNEMVSDTGRFALGHVTCEI